MNTMLFPVTLKKKENDDGYPYWFAEQKQLNVCASEYGMEDCLDSIRDKIKRAFKEMGCTEEKFARLTLNLVAAKAEIEVDIKIHRTLDEFTAGEETPKTCDGDCLGCDCAEGDLPPCEAAEDPEWEPKPFEHVTIRDPTCTKECGIFYVEDRYFQTRCQEGYVLISPIDCLVKSAREDLEIEKSRLIKGPEKPNAKFCKDRNCEDYVSRGPGSAYECKLTGYTSSYNKVCPKDEAAILSHQTTLIAEAKEKGEA